MSVQAKNPLEDAMELVPYKGAGNKDILIRRWERDMYELLSSNGTHPASFVVQMINSIYGGNKIVLVLDKDDPYAALEEIKKIFSKQDIVISIKNQSKVVSIAS